MISKEELKNLYETDLKESLSSLEGKRKILLRLQLIAIALIAITFFVLFPMSNENTRGIITVVGIALIVGAVILFIISSRKKKVYRAEYKSTVVSKIVHAIDSKWKYSADNRISQSEYHASDMFNHSVDRYNGDDLIQGVIDKTDFRCSELHTEYKTYTTDNDGHRKEQWHTIFKGLFFHADFNKEFKGQTYISPDHSEKLFGKALQSKKVHKRSGKAELVKLENIEFEKLFKVYSSDQIEARYILTPVIMEALVNIRNQYKRPLNLSFIGSRVYCAVSFNKNLFEPRVFKSGVNFKDIDDMHSLFMLNSVIIEELNLNTRIWTKN